MTNLVGLVLCGGRSSRMGKDKGLLKKGWQTWSQRAEDLLLELGIPVYVSINKSQLSEYKQFHAVESLVIDQVEVKGPLAGILSTHKRFPESDLLVLASDMIFIQAVVLEYLTGMSCLLPQAEVLVYEGKYLQPLCAIYKASFLQSLLEKQEGGHLTDFSLQNTIRSAKLHRVLVKKEQEEWFRNCNYESDIYEPTH